MEENSIESKDSSLDISTSSSPDTTSTKSILDLNYECFAEICKYLNLESQYSLLRCCKHMHDLVLLGIWHPHHKTGFNLDIDSSMTKLSIEAQAGFLQFVLRNFAIVGKINLIVFNSFLKMASRHQKFPHITSLSIENYDLTVPEHRILKFIEFRRFPNLLHLELKHITLDFTEKFSVYGRLAFIRDIIKSCNVLRDYLKFGIENDNEKIILISYEDPISINCVTGYHYRLHLKEITFNSVYIQHTESWIQYYRQKRISGYVKLDYRFYSDLMRAYYREIKLYTTSDYAANIDAVLDKFFDKPSSTHLHTKQSWRQAPQLKKSKFQKFLDIFTANKYGPIQEVASARFEGLKMEYFKAFIKDLQKLKKIR